MDREVLCLHAIVRAGRRLRLARSLRQIRRSGDLRGLEAITLVAYEGLAVLGAAERVRIVGATSETTYALSARRRISRHPPLASKRHAPRSGEGSARQQWQRRRVPPQRYMAIPRFATTPGGLVSTLPLARGFDSTDQREAVRLNISLDEN